MESISMSIDKKFFDDHKTEWLKQGETDGYETPTYVFQMNDIGYDSSEIDGNDIHISGISDKEGNINLSVWHELDLDLAGEVLEYYVKKVNKIKTILEATK